MERAGAMLYELPAELRQAVVEAEKPRERWTAHKMVRRFVEREHVLVVRRTIEAWRMQST